MIKERGWEGRQRREGYQDDDGCWKEDGEARIRVRIRKGRGRQIGQGLINVNKEEIPA